MTISWRLERFRDALNRIANCQPDVYVQMPLTTPSLANAREHFAIRARRAKAHRMCARLLMRNALAKLKAKPDLTWVACRITREAPRELDDDNLGSALKSVRDGVADALGVDDRHPSVIWIADSLKAQVPGVFVELYFYPQL